ncbi:hypothetical protein M9979_00245 [Sphingomonas sp. RP10(2022)]|uniref:Uncharacterized protein n=1 Tax=Sphingomonas liriopis TaxID=2949094 RepID=A0A9X2KNY7_9SPHN|nr:hypothetical protein [Sphingomonas liriopis]
MAVHIGLRVIPHGETAPAAEFVAADRSLVAAMADASRFRPALRDAARRMLTEWLQGVRA